MQITNAVKAEVLTQALPYIQKYHGQIIVVKYGGNAMINEELKLGVMRDLVLLNQIGIKVVLVHGGGPEITDTLKRMNIPSEFIGGLRKTTKETVDVVQMVLAGKVNKDLVNLIENNGGRAIGMCGIDGHMIEAAPVNAELGFVGEITNVNVSPITIALDAGYIPVISTVGYDTAGNVYNINADTVAARIAGELKACGYKFDRWLSVFWMEKHVQTVQNSLEFPTKWPVIVKNNQKICDILYNLSLSKM